MGNGEDFVTTSAEYMFLFPLMGGFIGLFAARYFLLSGFIISGLLGFVNSLVQGPTDFLLRLALAIMTIAFLLVLTGLQHFDGLVDLGNAIGLRRLEERREAAHAWIVTYKGAFLGIIVEFWRFWGCFSLTRDWRLGSLLWLKSRLSWRWLRLWRLGSPPARDWRNDSWLRQRESAMQSLT